MNVKQKCAEYASRMIQNGDVVGLGGGSTIQYLVEFLEEQKKDIQVVTPSQTTAVSCRKHGLKVVPMELIDHVDIAFDGCDEVDEEFNALKSKGGIHTLEKIVAAMAERYILLADETKYTKALSYKHTVVLEVLPQARAWVEKQLGQNGWQCQTRSCDQKDGWIITENGNVLIDVWIDEAQDAKHLYHMFRSITGVVEVSLFIHEVSGVVIARENTIEYKER